VASVRIFFVPVVRSLRVYLLGMAFFVLTQTTSTSRR